MTSTATRRDPTLLRVLVSERRLTAEGCLELLHARAERMGEHRFSLSERQLRRWMAGRVNSLDGLRPANVRVIEEEFGRPINELLTVSVESGLSALAHRPVSTDGVALRTGEFVDWVVTHSTLGYDQAHRAVAEAAENARSPTRHRNDAGPGPSRARLADAVGAYYGYPEGLYRGRVGTSQMDLTVVTNPGWVGLSIPLGSDAERCELVERAPGPPRSLTDAQAHYALDRLAIAEATGTVLVNNPLYRLLDVDVAADHLDARFGCSEFAAYTLTADLLEAELRHLTASGVRDPKAASTPNRDAWLPTIDAALDYRRRDCVGGVVCLVAIAGPRGYHLLLQERSPKVLNVAGTLAVIPKAFHQPTVDAFDEVPLSTTLEREIEEELLGRPDLELLSGDSGRRAAPLHPANSSLPMCWLHEHPEAWRTECTAFGINLVTGNFEFACLAVVQDPAWWMTYGHLVEANWEASRVHRYSSMDSEGLTELATAPRWSNEALFAFVEGLRRLGELDPARVALTAGAAW